MFRALGASDPPSRIEIDGAVYARVRIFKHDSWAATALYEGAGGLVVCKFNRRAPLGLIPMLWLGKLLARREAAALRRLCDLPNIPRCLGDVFVAGARQPNAVAHDYIPGRPLRRKEWPSDDFFPELAEALQEIHRRGMAYVDLHKRENILVGDDGQPYLIDFQISFAIWNWWPGNSLPLRALLRLLQESDLYHLAKHVARAQPGQRRSVTPPWWIRAHRRVGVPFRTCRRRLLTWLGIRSPGGEAASELFVEEGLREEYPANEFALVD
jgi:hypothetical protein